MMIMTRYYKPKMLPYIRATVAVRAQIVTTPTGQHIAQGMRNMCIVGVTVVYVNMMYSIVARRDIMVKVTTAHLGVPDARH